MLLRINAHGDLCEEGFRERVLEDGRTCLMWAKGYSFDSSAHMSFDDEMINWLVPRLGDKGLSHLVAGMNGCFAVIVVWTRARVVEVGIDRFGTIPIYYLMGDDNLIVSDDFWQIASRLPAIEYDPGAILGMVFLGYVAGYRTLLRNITELPQASIHRFSFTTDRPGRASQRYWMPSYSPGTLRKPEVWREGFAQTLDAVFTRHAQAVLNRGWDVHIPLSGGKDSRLLAGISTREAVPVRAFSYGPTGNPETQSAGRVADALGIQFRCVPINNPFYLKPSLIQMMTERVGMRARFTAGVGAQVSLVEFSERNVYVPGHSGALAAGSYISRGALLVRTASQMARLIIDSHSLPVLDEVASALFPEIWNAETRAQVILDTCHFEAHDPVGSIDRWNLENRQH